MKKEIKENILIALEKIEEKKKKSTQQGKAGSTTNKTNSGPSKGFKSMKRAGSLNK